MPPIAQSIVSRHAVSSRPMHSGKREIGRKEATGALTAGPSGRARQKTVPTHPGREKAASSPGKTGEREIGKTE